MKVKLFSHVDMDGIGCAILGLLAFGKENIDIEYCNYDDINIKVKKFLNNKEYEKYSNVFITDISVNEENAELINNISMNSKYTWTFNLLDHHSTAEWLNKYEWADIIVKDILIWKNEQDKLTDESLHKTSGTYLFYKWLIDSNTNFKNIEKLGDQIDLNHFIEMVRKYDTWEWKNIYNDQEPKQWNDLFYILGRDKFINNIIEKVHSRMEFNNTDKLLLELEQKKIDRYIESKNKELITKDIQGYKAGVIFGEQYHSELGNRLCELHPELDFIVIINMSKAISYRSIGDKVDLGKDVASIYKGGGHINSAGSPISDEFRKMIIDKLFD